MRKRQLITKEDRYLVWSLVTLVIMVLIGGGLFGLKLTALAHSHPTTGSPTVSQTSTVPTTITTTPTSTVSAASTIPTTSTSSTPTASATSAVPTASVTSTVPTTPATTAGSPPTLSCASPATLSLGPISELSSQSASGAINLCASGSGTLHWLATWKTAQAPWLSLSSTSGSVTAPNSHAASITATATATSLAAGTYSTTLTFTSSESQTTQIVTVVFTVKVGCVTASSQSLGFTGIVTTSNPATQNVTIANCNLKSDWRANVTGGSSWLSVSPTSGTLANKATATLTVTATNVSTNLAPGTYTGTIAVKLGSQSVTITVTFTVVPQPILSVSPSTITTTLDPNYCTVYGKAEDICTLTLTNQSSYAPLAWTATAWANATDLNASNALSATSGTLDKSGTASVTAVFYGDQLYCVPGGTITITFKGPANSVIVTVIC